MSAHDDAVTAQAQWAQEQLTTVSKSVAKRLAAQHAPGSQPPPAPAAAGEADAGARAGLLLARAEQAEAELATLRAEHAARLLGRAAAVDGDPETKGMPAWPADDPRRAAWCQGWRAQMWLEKDAQGPGTPLARLDWIGNHAAQFGLRQHRSDITPEAFVVRLLKQALAGWDRGAALVERWRTAASMEEANQCFEDAEAFLADHRAHRGA